MTDDRLRHLPWAQQAAVLTAEAFEGLVAAPPSFIMRPGPPDLFETSRGVAFTGIDPDGQAYLEFFRLSVEKLMGQHRVAYLYSVIFHELLHLLQLEPFMRMLGLTPHQYAKYCLDAKYERVLPFHMQEYRLWQEGTSRLASYHALAWAVINPEPVCHLSRELYGDVAPDIDRRIRHELAWELALHMWNLLHVGIIKAPAIIDSLDLPFEVDPETRDLSEELFEDHLEARPHEDIGWGVFYSEGAYRCSVVMGERGLSLAKLATTPFTTTQLCAATQ